MGVSKPNPPNINIMTRREFLVWLGRTSIATWIAACANASDRTPNSLNPLATGTPGIPATPNVLRTPTALPLPTGAPTVSPDKLTAAGTPPKVSVIKNLYLGQGEKGSFIGQVKGNDTPINTLFSPDKPTVPAGFGIDQEFLTRFFKAQIVDGVMVGETPGKVKVTLNKGIWTAPTGEVFIPFFATRKGSDAQYLVIDNSGRLQEVDVNGNPVGVARPMFETPQAVAGRLKVPNASLAIGVEFTNSGALSFVSKQSKPTKENQKRTMQIITEVDFLGPREDLSKNSKALAILKDGLANGSLSKGASIESATQQLVRNKKKNADMVLVRDSKTEEPMLVGDKEKTGEWSWRVAGLNDLTELFGISLGSMTDGGFNDLVPVTDVMKQDFAFSTEAGTFFIKYFNNYGPPRAFSNAAKLGIGLRVQEVFRPQEDYGQVKDIPNIGSQKDAMDYLKKRSDDILSLVSIAKKGTNIGPMDVVLWNEPWWKDGQTPSDMNDNLIRFMGGSENAIVESYVAFYKLAREKNLAPGVDFNIIGINMPGLEIDSQYANTMTVKISAIKKKIAAKLQLDEKKLNFDIGIQFHLGQAQGERNITLPIPLDSGALQTWLGKLNGLTGSRLHITEADFIGEKKDAALAYATLYRAACNSNSVDSMNFWSTFNSKGDWQNPLLEPQKQKTDPFMRSDVYRGFKAGLTAQLDSTS